MKAMARILNKIEEVKNNHNDYPVGYLGGLREVYENKLTEKELKHKIELTKIMILVSPNNLKRMFKGNLKAYNWILKEKIKHQSISWR